MRFEVLQGGAWPSAAGPRAAFLVTDAWDDWWKYNTQYYLIFRDGMGDLAEVGHVKIGQLGMPPKLEGSQNRPDLPEIFSSLAESFFSVGQDDSYYQRLIDLGDDLRVDVLSALRDMAFDEAAFATGIDEDVTRTSLLRSVSTAAVQGQFRRMARGGARLTSYAFEYVAPDDTADGRGLALCFFVTPESQPPSNVHVIIGRNGVGKTHLLHHLSLALVGDEPIGVTGSLKDLGTPAEETFAGLVSVTFSAFDDFEPLPTPRKRGDRLLYVYVGLKRKGAKEGEPPKGPKALAQEFGTSVKMCLQASKQMRWRRALEMLEADPIFADANVANLADETVADEELRERARARFRSLSSGHKVVLLTITRLVETVEERTLVLIDEPEAHLHPPLLSAFVRALSDLLVDRNGVAIIATHSPVVLQEVPRSCVWILRRSGVSIVAERPAIETFGENVGILTREVFGLEVTASGYHRLLREAVNRGDDLDDVLGRFDGQIGSEARALVQGLVAYRQDHV